MGWTGNFTDRSEVLAAFERFTASDQQLVVLWGLAGMGKSRVIAEISAPESRYRCSTVDLARVIAGRGDGPTQSPVGELLARVADALTAWEESRHLVEKFTQTATQAIEFLRSSDVQVLIQARNHSAVTDNRTTVVAGPSAEAFATYRRKLVSGLVELAGQVTQPGILLLDSSELLTLLDDFAQESESDHMPLSHWFTHTVLPQLLDCNRNIKMVIAGRDRLRFPVGLDIEYFELTGWQAEHTAEYLQSCGISDDELIATAHEVCNGVPIWLALLAEWNSELRRTGEHLTSGLIRRSAAGRPTQNWLVSTFTERLSPAQQRVLAAAVVLRSITREALAELLSDEELPNAWFERFASHSFVRETAGVLEIHAMIRQVLLDDLEVAEPRRLLRMHRTAAEYCQDVGLTLEEAYHRFATGDMSLADWWASATEAAIVMHDFGAAAHHLGSVSGQAARLQRMAAIELLARASYLTGRLEFFRARWPQARAALRDATERFAAIGDEVGTADTLIVGSDIEYQHGDLATATANAERALTLYRRSALPIGEGNALLELSWIAIRTGDYDKAASVASQAEQLYDSANSDYWRGEALRVMSWAERLRHRREPAEAAARTSLAIYRRLGNPRGQVNTLLALVEVLLDHDEFDDAEKYTNELLSATRKIEYREGQAFGLVMSAAVAVGQGFASIAAKRAGDALAQSMETGHPLWQGRSLMIRSKAYLALRRFDEADADAKRAQRLFIAIGDRPNTESVSRMLAEIAEHRGTSAD